MIAQHPLITEWYQHELTQHHHQREDAGVVIGFPLWGGAYVRRFLDYMLPSMLAPYNRRALDEYRTEFVLYVDVEAKQYLKYALSPLPVYLRLIPDDVMQVLREHPGYKYTVMTAVHNLLIHQAAQKGAGFSMAVADIVYSERYFERLLALGQEHDAIALLALIASHADAHGELDVLRRNGVLALSAAELGSLGWRHACGLMKSWLMNDATPDDMPLTHFPLWRGHDYVRMHCPHLSPVWLSRARCKTAPLSIGDTIDATGGPQYMGAGYYVPKVTNDICVITLDGSRDHPADRGNFKAFVNGLRPYWYCMPQLKQPVMVPTLPAEDSWLPDEVIETRFQNLMHDLGI